jgi:hypothetical protein
METVPTVSIAKILVVEHSQKPTDTKFLKIGSNPLTDQPRSDVGKYGKKCDSNLTLMTSVRK